MKEEHRAHTAKGGVSDNSARNGDRGSEAGYVMWVRAKGLYSIRDQGGGWDEKNV